MISNTDPLRLVEDVVVPGPLTRGVGIALSPGGVKLHDCAACQAELQQYLRTELAIYDDLKAGGVCRVERLISYGKKGVSQ